MATIVFDINLRIDSEMVCSLGISDSRLSQAKHVKERQLVVDQVRRGELPPSLGQASSSD